MTDAPTVPELIVEHLARSQIRSAYPVMHAAEPSLSLSRWLSYARPTVKGQHAREGILVVRRAGSPYLCGAVCYRQQRSMKFGMVLVAEHVIALDLLHPQVLLAALMQELDVVALRLGCSAIRSILHTDRASLVEDLGQVGHHREGITLTKVLNPPPNHSPS